MPEDAGKPKLIKDFLQQVQSGTGLLDDIRIERIIRLPGTTGEGSTARSLSGRKISNVTELLEDDLKHTFDEGYFTFRFVAALVGSGKTSLLHYLQELTQTKPTYENHSVVVRFQLSDISLGNDFFGKLYCHILADTFWTLLHNSNLLVSVKEMAEKILMDFLEKDEVSQLKAANKLMPFRSKFKKYIIQSVDGFEQFFFDVIEEISSVDPKFSFVYLIDELDALAKFPSELEETRLLFKQLIRRAFQQCKSKVRLLIYLVGTSENVGSFIAGDSVIESLVSNSVINLYQGYLNEFDLIRQKIDQRIEGAYKGYKNFSQAWKELQEIHLTLTDTLREFSISTLREFCKFYANEMLKIHEKYFQEAPEQKFEGDARQLVEAECRKYWVNYLKKSSYSLSKASTTTVISKRAFDCYVELLHNGVPVARAFGEAKNYELLTGHLQTFEKWLEDAKCELTSSQEHPPDLAFMIAPSCPTLLQRKLELKNIHFIKSGKQVVPPPPPPNPDKTKNKPVSINTGSREQLISAFKGTGMKQNTIDSLINLRESKVYNNLDELVADLKSTNNVKKKLQDKLSNRIICF